MAFDEKLASTVREILAAHPGITEKKMFGGLCFMLRGNMTCGVMHDKLMLRVSFADYEPLLKKPHVVPMDFTGRPLKGMLYVLPAALKRPADVARWLAISLAYAATMPQKVKKRAM